MSSHEEELAVAYSRFEPISVEAALAAERKSVEVQAGNTLILHPLSADFSDCFHVVQLSTFDDLKRLHFIPDHMEEDSSCAALRADDLVAHTATSRLLEEPALDFVPEHLEPCGCDSGPHGRKQSDERSTYAHLYRPNRRRHQEHLIALLQPNFRESLTWDHPSVGATLHAISRWVKFGKQAYHGIFALKDIEIGRDATLTLSPTSSVLFAGNISIETGGTLRFLGRNVSATCDTLSGPNRFASATLNPKRFVGYDADLTFLGGQEL